MHVYYTSSHAFISISITPGGKKWTCLVEVEVTEPNPRASPTATPGVLHLPTSVLLRPPPLALVLAGAGPGSLAGWLAGCWLAGRGARSLARRHQPRRHHHSSPPPTPRSSVQSESNPASTESEESANRQNVVLRSPRLAHSRMSTTLMSSGSIDADQVLTRALSSVRVPVAPPSSPSSPSFSLTAFPPRFRVALLVAVFCPFANVSTNTITSPILPNVYTILALFTLRALPPHDRPSPPLRLIPISTLARLDLTMITSPFTHAP